MATAELCLRHGISGATIYKWKANYRGLEVSEAKRLLGGPCFNQQSQWRRSSTSREEAFEASGEAITVGPIAAAIGHQNLPAGHRFDALFEHRSIVHD
jgi:hypothetical protein